MNPHSGSAAAASDSGDRDEFSSDLDKYHILDAVETLVQQKDAHAEATSSAATSDGRDESSLELHEHRVLEALKSLVQERSRAESAATSILDDSECASELDKLHVLVVDGDPTSLKVIKEMLLQIDNLYEAATTCSRGEEAISVLQKGKAKINLVLMELDLPDMHGYKLLRWICRNTDIAVVVMTAEKVGLDRMMRSIDLGAHLHLNKPMSNSSLWMIGQCPFQMKYRGRSPATAASDAMDFLLDGDMKD